MGELTRRGLLAGGAALGGAVALGARGAGAQEEGRALANGQTDGHDGHAMFKGTVDHGFNGFTPQGLLRDFDWGVARRLPNGRTLREWELVATDREIEVAPGVRFAAWTYNGRIPGPTLRAREGDRMRITFVNGSAHPHTIHFHGIHRAEMDGVPGVGPGVIEPGGRTVYEFDALPFGLHLYHCHVRPLAEHIAKGMYGAVVIDPKEERAEADEMVMVMNAFDTNFDRANEIYAVNSIGFAHMDDPVRVKKDELVRVYLVNITEFDLVNSLHLHGNFFDYIPTGTSLKPSEYTDTVMLCQGQRGILETRFPYTGKYMFHAHQSEFAELGWQGFFEVT